VWNIFRQSNWGHNEGVRLEIAFGTRLSGGRWIEDAQWDQFVDDVIAPRFPSGFSLYAAEGRWRHSTGAFHRDRTRILLVWAPRTQELRENAATVARLFKQRFGVESVFCSMSSSSFRIL
jgi:hypothetical protein